MLVIYLVVGLAIGSFITALVPRFELKRPKSILTDRSRCPKCAKVIKWHDNIPLLSYVLLKGKCRNCGKKISAFYPLTEGISAIIFLTVYFVLTGCGEFNSVVCTYSQTMSPIIFLLFFVVLYVLLAAIFIIDVKHQIIPDELSLSGFGIVTLVLMLTGLDHFYINLFVGFVSALFFLLVHLITKGRGMGLGDAKLSLFTGTLVGWPGIVVYFYTAFISGALFGITALLIGKAKFGKRIAFGPFLVIGTLIAFTLPFEWLVSFFPFLF